MFQGFLWQNIDPPGYPSGLTHREFLPRHSAAPRLAAHRGTPAHGPSADCKALRRTAQKDGSTLQSPDRVDQSLDGVRAALLLRLEDTARGGSQHSLTRHSVTQDSVTRYSVTQDSVTRHSVTRYSVTRYSVTRHSVTRRRNSISVTRHGVI